MKKSKNNKKYLIIAIAIILITIVNFEKLQFLYYIITNSSDNSKVKIEKEYNIQVTSMMKNKKDHLYEGIERDTHRKKYIVQVRGKGVFVLFADEGIDLSTAQVIAQKNGFPSPPIYFCIKDTFSEKEDLKDYLYWYFINDNDEILYISFKDGSVSNIINGD